MHNLSQLPQLSQLSQLAIYLGLGLPIAWIDLRTHRIPNRLSAALASGTVFTSLISNNSISSATRSGLSLAGALLAIFLLIPGSIGAGDIKLAFSVGWFASPTPIPLILAIASSTGLLFALSRWFISTVREKPAKIGQAIPFAPFLLLGGLSSMWTSLH